MPLEFLLPCFLRPRYDGHPRQKCREVMRATYAINILDYYRRKRYEVVGASQLIIAEFLSLLYGRRDGSAYATRPSGH